MPRASGAQAWLVSRRLHQDTTHLEDDASLLADCGNVIVTHERVEVNLVQNWELNLLVDKLLNVSLAKIGDTD